MTPRLKNVKEPPLLNPPSRITPARVSQEDIELFQSALGYSRDPPEIFRDDTKGVLLTHYYAKMLGIRLDVTQEDRSIMEGCVHRAGSGYELAQFHHMLRCLDMPRRIKDGEWETIQGSLQKARTEKDGSMVAATHYHLRQLGRPQDLTTDDRLAMEGELAGLRRRMREPDTGWKMAFLYYHMKKLDVKTTLPTEDMAFMEGCLANACRERRFVTFVPMLQHMSELASKEAEKAEIPMPPLRRFERSGR